MPSGDSQTGEGAATPWLRDAAASALRYWEPRRALYDAGLALVVLDHALEEWPPMRLDLGEFTLKLIFLAVLANVAYCAAYVADLFVQMAGLGSALRWFRPSLLFIGTVVAAILTHWISAGLFRVD